MDGGSGRTVSRGVGCSRTKRGAGGRRDRERRMDRGCYGSMTCVGRAGRAHIRARATMQHAGTRQRDRRTQILHPCRDQMTGKHQNLFSVVGHTNARM